MNIGIITYHRAHNYGAVLQCYALSTTLRLLGHDVEVIDYYPDYFKEQYNAFSFKKIKQGSLKSKISYLKLLFFTYFTKSKRGKVFNNFIEKLPLTKIQYSEKNYCFKKYDAIFFGSDQVWNPLLTFGEDNVFSGNFDKQGGRFISYAASTNPKILNDDYKNYFKGIADRFDAISAREQSLSDYINSLAPGSSKVVLDPVLLLNEVEWSKVAVKPREENYLLIYTVPQSDKIWTLAEMIAKAKGLKIIEVRPNVRFNIKNNILQTVSPEEFLGYIKYATYIVTTSFHGTAFSLKFKKQFVTLSLGTHVDDRAKNLLSSLGLTERMMPQNNLYIPEDQIDYTIVDGKLSTLITDSINFIKKSL